MTLDFIDDLLLIEPNLLRWTVPNHERHGLTHIGDDFIAHFWSPFPSHAVTSSLVLLFNSIGTVLRNRHRLCCFRNVKNRCLPFPTLRFFIFVSSRTLSRINCEILNSTILFNASSFLACSAEFLCSRTPRSQKN